MRLKDFLVFDKQFVFVIKAGDFRPHVFKLDSHPAECAKFCNKCRTGFDESRQPFDTTGNIFLFEQDHIFTNQLLHDAQRFKASL
ncbi:hypothetical protein D3C87_1470670 [compost metagenome]